MNFEVNVEHDIDDFSSGLLEYSDRTPPPIPTPEKEFGDGTMLEPDHPLLAKFQQALKEQLERQVRKLSEEVTGLEVDIKKKSSERDALGVDVYDAQQLVTKQHAIIDQYAVDVRAYVTEREEIENELNIMRNNYKTQKQNFEQVERKEKELRTEVETVSFMMTQMTEWETKLQSDLAVNHRVSDKTKLDKVQFAEEKRNLDFLIYKLMTEVFRLENSLETLDMQLDVKEEEREILANSIAEADAEIESLESEGRRLMHSWNCVLVAIGHRDGAYFATKNELETRQEDLRTLLTEIASVRKQSNEEMLQNEQFTLVKGRLDMDKQSIQAKMTSETNKFINLDRKLIETQAILTQTVKDLDETSLERKMKERDLNLIVRELERNHTLKNELEDRILARLQQQIISDKISKYINKTIRDQREQNRNLEIQLNIVENKNAEIAVAIEHQKIKGEESILQLEEVLKLERAAEKEVNALNNELSSITNQIKKKQIRFDTVNKKCEDILSKSGGVTLTPQQVKIKDLERQISELDDKNQKLKSFWLRQQSYIISLKEQREKQLTEKNLMQKQTTLMEQKNLRLEDELEELDKQERRADRNMSNIKLRIDKIYMEILKKRDKKDCLDISTEAFRFESVQILKEAELECIELESELMDLEEEKDAMSKELIEANRESLAWERKLRIAIETKQSIAAEKGAEGEMGVMRAEIHRMSVRHSQLRKAQEKLILDLNHCLSRREFIAVNAEATEQRLSQGGGKVNNRLNFKRKIETMKSKVSKTEQNRKTLEKKIVHAYAFQKELTEKITEYETAIDEKKQKIDEIINDCENLKLNRNKELEVLVFKQHKLRAFTYIAKNQYRPLFRSLNAVETQNAQQIEVNEKLQTVVENLMSDFPNHYHTFMKILNTLKLIHEIK